MAGKRRAVLRRVVLVHPVRVLLGDRQLHLRGLRRPGLQQHCHGLDHDQSGDPAPGGQHPVHDGRRRHGRGPQPGRRLRHRGYDEPVDHRPMVHRPDDRAGAGRFRVRPEPDRAGHDDPLGDHRARCHVVHGVNRRRGHDLPAGQLHGRGRHRHHNNGRRSLAGHCGRDRDGLIAGLSELHAHRQRAASPRGRVRGDPGPEHGAERELVRGCEPHGHDRAARHADAPDRLDPHRVAVNCAPARWSRRREPMRRRARSPAMET